MADPPRRQSHGSAWHWRQTDCWYDMLPGTKKRIPLLDEDGVSGRDNKEQARLALARGKWRCPRKVDSV